MAKLLLRGPSRICKLTRIHQYKHNATWLKVLWMSSCASCAEECRWTPLLTLASGVGRVETLASPSRLICSTTTPSLIVPSCEDDGATLDDLREAVATLESVAPLWKRVFGPSHPETPLVQNALEDAREALAARAA